MTYDVLIIGAGPAGLTAGRRLAERGWSVGVLEEHPQVGIPVNCSGVLGVEAFERFRIPASLIRHSLQSVEFISPQGRRWEFDTPHALARVVLRSDFDRLLAHRARNAGADVLLEHRVTEVRPERSHVEVRVGRDRVLRSRALVVATGAGMPLLRKLDFGDAPSRLLGVQTELDLPARQVEVYFGRQWAPEGFAWVIPLDERRSKVGLLCHRDGPGTLRRFLSRPDLASRAEGEPGPIHCSVLPLGFLKKSFSDRVLVVGEAAGHIKTTTCGGIYYGMRTAEIAADVLDVALDRNRLEAKHIAPYETRWRALLQEEIESGLRLRRSFKLMSDWGIERLISLAKRDGVVRLIRDNANFDWHRDLIHAVFRHATVGRILGAA